MSLEHRVVGLLEDDPIMGESLVQRLALEGTVVRWWTTGREALADLDRARPEAVVCDIRLPDMSGEEVFRVVAGRDAAPPFLFITGYGDIDQAVRLIRAGAGDYLAKPFEMPVFLDRLSGLLPSPQTESTQVLGLSQAMQGIERTLRRVSRVRSTVLFTGETGVGKEVSARFLHEATGHSAPFMAVNCAAIPAELLDAELFGHERGAFTGAQARHLGWAERAGEGTLFLDEIGDLAPALQAKLLRLLEDRQFYRVGGESPLSFRARIVCATNADLERRVREGRFREDLFYRVNVVSVAVPPLRDRREDIAWLLERFFDQFNTDGELAGVSGLAEEAALQHGWPGNVRELRNRVERGVALALGPWLMPGDLFPERIETVLAPAAALPSLEDARLAAERRHILLALTLTGGEIMSASKVLAISRTTLWEKMRRLGISSPATSPSGNPNAASARRS
jgi:DNA-binding NtrC family response regulator